MSQISSAEAQQFRGKTLSPESPRPVHVAEPSNIPVLQNQTDPIFNLMSTHMDHPHASRDLTEMDHEIATNANKCETVGHEEDTTQQTLSSDHNQSVAVEQLQDYSALPGHEQSVPLHQEQEPDLFSIPLNYTQNHSTSMIDQTSAIDISDALPSIPNQAKEPSTSLDPPTLEGITQSMTDPSMTQENNVPMTSEQFATTVETSHDSLQQDTVLPQTGDNHQENVDNGGVNFQALLDNISPSNPIATPMEDGFAKTSGAPKDVGIEADPNNTRISPAALQTSTGLPPRPPPQEKPAIHPNYTPGDDIRTYHFPHANQSKPNPTQSTQSSSSYRPIQGFSQHTVVAAAGAPGTSSAPNGLPPPPLATFQQPPPGIVEQPRPSPSIQQSRQNATSGDAGNGAVPPDNMPWPPEIQRKYDEFLSDERVYVAEGLWDRFPAGSRLFVGNLPTESVTKRDLFHIFYKYGRLAQISIKQAYGFIQYLDAECSHRALQSEQNMPIKDRKMHLEISKPQKNNRNAAPTAAGDSLRASQQRRSRSPSDQQRGTQQRGSNQRMSGDRFDRGKAFNDFRDEPRRRDDYRPVRSPSPRGFRVRDEYRSGGPDRYYGSRRSRSRSPPYGRSSRYRSPSPPRQLDEDAALPIPRRDPRDVPDVQLILVDELDRAFVGYIDKAFRDRGLRTGVLFLPRVPIAAVIKRQILEGVQAVIKLYRHSQVTGKIPLQVFDRSAGVDNVRFEEYDELDTNIAAELVVRAKATHAVPEPPQTQYTPQSYGQPQYGQPPAQQHQQSGLGSQPNLANLITSLDGAALQKLLGAMQQGPQTPSSQQAQAPQQHQQHQYAHQAQAQTPDLAALFGGVNREQGNPQSNYQYQGVLPSQQQQTQPNPYNGLAMNQVLSGNPALASLLANGANQQAAPAHQQGQQQHVQSLMEQLAKWKQQ